MSCKQAGEGAHRTSDGRTRSPDPRTAAVPAAVEQLGDKFHFGKVPRGGQIEGLRGGGGGEAGRGHRGRERRAAAARTPGTGNGGARAGGRGSHLRTPTFPVGPPGRGTERGVEGRVFGTDGQGPSRHVPRARLGGPPRAAAAAALPRRQRSSRRRKRRSRPEAHLGGARGPPGRWLASPQRPSPGALVPRLCSPPALAHPPQPSAAPPECWPLRGLHPFTRGAGRGD